MSKVLVGCVGVLALFVCTFVALLSPVVGLASLFGGASTSAYAGGGGGSIVEAALTLSSHLKLADGVWNSYDVNDPALQGVIKYWEDVYCGTGTLCDNARPGNLQCVGFVRGALFMAGHPVAAVGDGKDFYADPNGALKDWIKVPVGQMPAPGDIISWEWDSPRLYNGVWANYGHVAIIVQVDPPAGGKNGDVIVAEGNAAGNEPNWLDPRRQESLWRFTLKPDLSLVSWSGYTLLGYRRPPASYTAPIPGTGGGINNIPPDVYKEVAEANKKYIALTAGYAAGHYAGVAAGKPVPGLLPVKYFVRQIWQESKFDPTANPPADAYDPPIWDPMQRAYGIAQFMPDVAEQWDVNRKDVNSSLYGAVRYMVADRDKFANGSFRSNTRACISYNGGPFNFSRAPSAFNPIEAFGLALVAYNGGMCAALKAAQCGAEWRNCIPSAQSRDYVRIIMRD